MQKEHDVRRHREVWWHHGGDAAERREAARTNLKEQVRTHSCRVVTIAHQAPLPMEFSRQEYWSELPFPSPWDLPDPETEPESPHCRQILYCLRHQESPEISQMTLNRGQAEKIMKNPYAACIVLKVLGVTMGLSLTICLSWPKSTHVHCVGDAI